MQLNIEFNANNINNFLFRIKKTYKKNKKFQIIMKTKKKMIEKFQLNLLKKNI